MAFRNQTDTSIQCTIVEVLSKTSYFEYEEKMMQIYPLFCNLVFDWKLSSITI